MRTSRQIDLLLLCFGLIGAILPAGNRFLTTKNIETANRLSQPRWTEESLVARGEKINLQIASAPGLELIEGIGHTVARSIILGRPKLLERCNNTKDSRIAKTNNTEQSGNPTGRKATPALELQALDSLPGIGLTRSKAIIKYLTICRES
jgi:DNA uptake protein ComE-like DNA-binding protein